MKIETEHIKIETEFINDTERIHVDTEHIIKQLNTYCTDFINHPFFKAIQNNKIPTHTLHKFACYQYSDSIIWIPMLALMKEKVVRSSRLRTAIEENIKCEAGIGGTSHVELAKNLIQSLNLNTIDQDATNHCISTIKFWISDEFIRMTEPEIVGWLLTAETLVPIMFKNVVEAYKNNSDIKYFSEHISVDTNEHSKWMIESTKDILFLYGKESLNQILFGMKEAWMEAVEPLNLIVSKLSIN